VKKRRDNQYGSASFAGHISGQLASAGGLNLASYNTALAVSCVSSWLWTASAVAGGLSAGSVKSGYSVASSAEMAYLENAISWLSESSVWPNAISEIYIDPISQKVEMTTMQSLCQSSNLWPAVKLAEKL